MYDTGSIPAATYQTPADVPTIVVPNLLLVKNDFADGNACALTKLLFDKKADLEKVHAAAAEISTENAARTDPVRCTRARNGPSRSSAPRGSEGGAPGGRTLRPPGAYARV